jgi:hypothetical protein
MALGDWQIFKWQSRAKQREEAEVYEKWAFPHGAPQREALQKLLLEVFPEGNVPTTLVPFLTCKELFEEAGRTRDEDAVIDHLINSVKKYKHILRKKDMATFIALVLADRAAGDTRAYPSADQIRAHAERLEALRRGDK